MWTVHQLAILHELCRGEATVSEIAAKLATVVERLAPYALSGEAE